MNIKIYAEVLENEALEQFYKAMSLPCNIQGALMPDAHAGYTLPIRAVIKSVDKIFPSYVGYDIGCGMCAVKTNIVINTIDLKLLKEEILKTIPVGRNYHTKKQILPKLPKGTNFGNETLKQGSAYQLGTLGGGNHFIEIGIGDDEFLNIIIHSGSRNIGKKIAEHYMKLAAIEDIDKQKYEKEFDSKNSSLKNKDQERYQKEKEEFV